MRPAGDLLVSPRVFDAVRDDQLNQQREAKKPIPSFPGPEASLARSAEAHLPFVHSDGEVVSAWRLLTFNWKLLGSIAGVVIALLIVSEFYVEPSGYVVIFTLAALYRSFGLRNARSTARANPRVFFSLVSLAQVMLAIPVIVMLTYVATSINLPLQDERLLAWDRALGFDFRSLLDFTNRHRELIPLFARTYSSIHLQMIMMVLVLPLAGCYRRGAEAICAYVLALLATTCISALVPAIGVYQALDLHAADYPHFEPQGYYDTLRDAPLVRAGQLHKLYLTQLVGVLTFPSFHAAAAILYMWAFWPLRWFRLVVIPWNMVMIVATPLGGGHYLSDIIAGIAVAASAIAFTARISAASSPARRDMPTDALSHRNIA